MKRVSLSASTPKRGVARSPRSRKPLPTLQSVVEKVEKGGVPPRWLQQLVGRYAKGARLPRLHAIRKRQRKRSDFIKQLRQLLTDEASLFQDATPTEPTGDDYFGALQECALVQDFNDLWRAVDKVESSVHDILAGDIAEEMVRGSASSNLAAVAKELKERAGLTQVEMAVLLICMETIGGMLYDDSHRDDLEDGVARVVASIKESLRRARAKDKRDSHQENDAP